MNRRKLLRTVVKRAVGAGCNFAGGERVEGADGMVLAGTGVRLMTLRMLWPPGTRVSPVLVQQLQMFTVEELAGELIRQGYEPLRTLVANGLLIVGPPSVPPGDSSPLGKAP